MAILSEFDIGSETASATVAEPGKTAVRRVATASTVDVRVMSYNILLGRRWDEALELIRRHDCDVICLQEVPSETGHWHGVTPDRVLRDIARPGAYAPLWYRPPRSLGNLTLVRGEIDSAKVLHLPPSRPYGILNRVAVHGVSLLVANVHMTPMMGPPPIAFPFSEIQRTREALHLSRTAGAHDGPALAVGDFNSFWPAPACLVMRRRWTDARKSVPGRHLATRPTYRLPFVIDHIFVRGPAEVVAYDVIDGPASDHRAVVARLRIPVRRTSSG